MAISLGQQIEEVDYELKMRRSVYPRLIALGKLRQAESEFHLSRLEAVKGTLEWLRDKEAIIRHRLSES